MKKILSKILMIVLLSTTLGIAYESSTQTPNSSRWSLNYSYEDKYKNKTEVKTFNLSNLKRIKLEADVEMIEGYISFKIVESGGKVIFRINNPQEFEKYINLSPNKNYRLLVELKNFVGEFEFDLESRN